MGGISLEVIFYRIFFGHLEINGKSVKGFNRQAEVVFFFKTINSKGRNEDSFRFRQIGQELNMWNFSQTGETKLK